jgi:hypothetical protein
MSVNVFYFVVLIGIHNATVINTLPCHSKILNSVTSYMLLDVTK